MSLFIVVCVSHTHTHTPTIGAFTDQFTHVAFRFLLLFLVQRLGSELGPDPEP